MKRKITFGLLALISTSIFAQKSSGDLGADIKQANLLILEQNYSAAIKYLLDAYKIDSLNANTDYKLGMCYLETPDFKDKALPYLEKAAENISHNYDITNLKQKVAPENTYRLLGIAYRVKNQMNESNIFFGKFKELVGTRNKEISDDLDRQIQINLNAVDFSLEKPKFKVTNLGDKFNTEYPDYTPVISSDGSSLYFTSRRPGGFNDEKTDDDQFFEDIYVSKRTKDGKWGNVQSAGPGINSADNEAISSLSDDGQMMFVGRSDIAEGDIYFSSFQQGDWGALVPMGAAVNSKSTETSACVTKDGNTLYFVSNKPEGSQGGKDIWMSQKLPDGQWGAATNMGPVINSPFDEESPFITADGNTLFFSSKGHKNMGGYDIFKSTKDKNGNWTEPENLKPPFNSTDDDLCYMQTRDGKMGYFSSVRKGGFGKRDLYSINIEKPEDKITLLKGSVTYDGTTKVPDNAKIIATDKSTKTVEQEVAPNKTGSYILTVHPGKSGKTYDVSYEAPGFQTLIQTINVPANSSYEEIEKELLLKTVNLESKTSGTMNIVGTIKNKDGKSIPGAQIVVKNNLSGQLISTNYTTADSGTYYFILKSGENYNLSYEGEGHLFQSENINIPKKPDYTKISKNIVLDKMEIGVKIILNNIFFDSNKATLRPESNTEIEKLHAMMQNNPKISIEIDGHTDNKGNAAANLSLSQQRSQAVVNELIKKGIDSKRLIAKGFGSTVPIAPNALPDGKPNIEGMQLNRRVEMKILQSQ